MKRLSGILLAALVTGGAVKLSYAQNGDNSGRFSTPAYSGSDYAQAGSGAGGAGAATPAQSAPRTAITPGSSSTAIQPQPGSGTAISPGAPAITPGTPAINPGVNTAITPPGTNNLGAGAATNGIVPQGPGTIGQQGNTAIGQQGTAGVGQQGVANPGAPGRPTPNGFIVNPDGSLTAVGGTAGTALGGTNTGAAAGGFVATNPPVLRTNTPPRSP